MPAGHDPYAALRHRDYRLLLAGTVLTSAASQMQSVAVGWELYGRTGSTAALGLVGLAQFLPVLLLSIPAGQAADHLNRKALYLTAQALAALASAGLAALSLAQGPVPLVYPCLVLAGAARAFSAPARWSLLPQVVPANDLPNAVTWNSSGWQVAAVVGPALGGLVLWWADRAAPAYALAAAGALACGGLVAATRPRPAPPRAEPPTLGSLLDGIRFVWNTPLILATITLDLFAVLLGGATALLPVYARDILDVGATGLGCLWAAPAVGAFVTALALAHRPPLQRAGRALLLAVAGFGAATIGFGLSRDPLLSFLLLAVAGAFDNVSVVVRATLVQLLTPDEMRGRVSAVNMIFVESSNKLGEFESGVTAAWFGLVASVVGGGIGTILVVLTVMLRWPQILRLGPLHAAKAETLEDVREPG
jgi:MFS family permease